MPSLTLCPTRPVTFLCLDRGELEEVLRYVKPQHFLPVHGEYAFLTAHAQVLPGAGGGAGSGCFVAAGGSNAQEKPACCWRPRGAHFYSPIILPQVALCSSRLPSPQLARDNGVNYTSVIRNGQMLGVAERRNKNTVSVGSAAGVAGAAEILGRERTDTMQMLGEVELINYYNDGNKVRGGEGGAAPGGRARASGGDGNEGWHAPDRRPMIVPCCIMLPQLCCIMLPASTGARIAPLCCRAPAQPRRWALRSGRWAGCFVPGRHGCRGGKWGDTCACGLPGMHIRACRIT